MNIALNEIDVSALAPLTRRPNNQDDYQISFYWTKSVLAVLATATQGTTLSYQSVEAFDEDIGKAIRAELQAIAWMSLASISDGSCQSVESARIKCVIEQLKTPITGEGRFPNEYRKGGVSAHCGRDLYDYSESVMVNVSKEYALYPMLRKSVVLMTQYQNFYTLYPVLREQIITLLSQRVAFLQKQGL